MAETLWVQSQAFSKYPIHVEASWERLSDCVQEVVAEKHRLCIVTDSNVAPLHLEAVKKEFAAFPVEVYTFVLPAGEENKNLDEVQKLYSFLIEHHFDRKDMLVAFGGGVVGDMTGFAAATYLRGIDFIQIPTTLLSQVDSSIGGKTGVDFASYKNMVGAFKQPRLVFINLSVLKTLPQKQLSSGMAEVIKHGCIKNKTYFQQLQTLSEEIMACEPKALEYVVVESLKIKRAVVEADPLEKGERALLNFGHTLGHAFENASGFTMTHGEGVALGCLAAAYLSMQRDMLTQEELIQLNETLLAFHLPTVHSDFTHQDILNAVLHDKKMDGKTLRFILLNHIGHGVIDRSIVETDLMEALNWIHSKRSSLHA